MTFAVSDCHDCFHVNLIVVRRFVFVFSVFFYSLFIFFVVLFSVFLVLLFSVCPHRVVCIFLISNGERVFAFTFYALVFFLSQPNATSPLPSLFRLLAMFKQRTPRLTASSTGCSEICMFYMPFRLSFCLLLSDVVAAAIAVVVVIVCCGLFKDSMLAAL